MSVKFYYNGKEFTTLEEAEAEVAVVYDILENKPTEWCQVKEVSGNAEDGWTIPSASLSDAEILSLDENKTYSVSSIVSGDSHIGISATEASAKILECRTQYANFKRANEILKHEIITPSTHDMSLYV